MHVDGELVRSHSTVAQRHSYHSARRHAFDGCLKINGEIALKPERKDCYYSSPRVLLGHHEV